MRRDTMTAETAVARMSNPAEFLRGRYFVCQINFIDPANPEEEAEASFPVDCGCPGWREELLKIWEAYHEAHGIPEDSVTDAWGTLDDETAEKEWKRVTGSGRKGGKKLR